MQTHFPDPTVLKFRVILNELSRCSDLYYYVYYYYYYYNTWKMAASDICSCLACKAPHFVDNR